MLRISKWDIVEDTSRNIDDEKRFMLVTSSNKFKVYGYPIDIKNRNIIFYKTFVMRCDELQVIGQCNFAETCIDIIEKVK